MADEWKTEYHVCRDGDAEYWLEDENEANQKAREISEADHDAEITVVEVISYLDDRREVSVFRAGVEEQEEG